jgi:hypothetical protein
LPVQIECDEERTIALGNVIIGGSRVLEKRAWSCEQINGSTNTEQNIDVRSPALPARSVSTGFSTTIH